GATDPTTSRAVDGLVAAKLVARQADPSDRRAVLHEATRRGRALAEARRTEIVAILDRALDGFAESERATLVVLLARLNAELRDFGPRPAELLASRCTPSAPIRTSRSPSFRWQDWPTRC